MLPAIKYIRAWLFRTFMDYTPAQSMHTKYIMHLTFVRQVHNAKIFRGEPKPSFNCTNGK